MTFEEFCQSAKVTPSERKKLVFFLALFRAQTTIEVLENPK